MRDTIFPKKYNQIKRPKNIIMQERNFSFQLIAETSPKPICDVVTYAQYKALRYIVLVDSLNDLCLTSA